MRVVIDTNVVWSGISSARGASREILYLVGEGVITPIISVPLILEYESVLKREEYLQETRLSARDVDDVLDYIIFRAELQQIEFLWRPLLPDAGDDCVLECAINGRVQVILTYNTRHFPAIKRQFGIDILTPRDFLRTIGGN